MKPEYKEKTVAYIVLAIVIVIALGVSIYAVITNPNNQPAPTSIDTSENQGGTVVLKPGQVRLTPEEVAIKRQQLAEINGQGQTILTSAEIKAKQAALKQIQYENTPVSTNNTK
jgi:hypothetical protein